jgi:hypothetical protein
VKCEYIQSHSPLFCVFVQLIFTKGTNFGYACMHGTYNRCIFIFQPLLREVNSEVYTRWNVNSLTFLTRDSI